VQSEEVTVLISAQFLPDCVEQGKRDLLELAQEVRRAEPDCLAIEMAQDVDDVTKITMIEKWSSRAAYEGPHMHTPHMQAFLEKSSGYFAGPPKISFYRGNTIAAK
jgi:quinol monooxygenase YgiN